MNSKTEQAVKYLQEILIGFCDNICEIKPTIDERGLVLNVIPDKDDAKFVIGRNGSVAMSLRTIMNLWSKKNKAVVKLLVYGDKTKL